MAIQKRDTVFMVVVTLAFCLGAVIYTAGYYPGGHSWPNPGSRWNPLPLNASVVYTPTDVTSGIYDVPHYSSFYGYTLNVTLLDVIKGEEANRLMAERTGARPMGAGNDFLLARFCVQVLEENVKSARPISVFYFWAVDSTGNTFYPQSYEVYEPLFGPDQLHKDDIVEGWIVMEYDKRETAPMIVFDHNMDSSIGLWFNTMQ